MINTKYEIRNTKQYQIINYSIKICLLFVISILLFTLSGCGERIESTYYYYSPSWTRGGVIIFIKGLESKTKNAINMETGSSYTESVATSEAAIGASDAFRFDVTGAPPYSMSCAPTADYVAYMQGLEGISFSKIIIHNISAGAHQGVDVTYLAFSPPIRSFDWSNDDPTKLVYCTSTEVHTITLNGTDALVTAESNISFVSWKYGTKIAFVHGTPPILSLIKADKTGRQDLTAAASVDKPQISSANNNIIYGYSGNSYCSVDVSAGAHATTTEVAANFKGQLPRLSTDATKVVYDKIQTGEQSGIYWLDVTTIGTSEVKIK